MPAGDDVEKLRERLKGLRVKTVEGAATSTVTAAGKYVFPANDGKLESLTFAPDADGKGASVSVTVNGVETKVACGYQDWKRGKGSYGAYKDEPAAATGAWTKDNTYVVKQVFYETPFYLTMTLAFTGAELSCAFETNVGFGATKKPAVVGKRE